MKKLALISLATVLGMTVSQNIPNKQASNFLATPNASLSFETSVPLLSAGSEPLIGGGLHDIIRIQSIQTLERWALTAEAHHNAKSGNAIIGGIHGWQNPLTKEEYEAYILDMAQIYTELNSPRELDRLSLVYNISNPSLLQFGGLHDFLFRQDRETLEKWALTAEAHNNAKAGLTVIGGIHGRENSLTNAEFADYIMDMGKIYPELNSASKLDALSVAYKIQAPQQALQIGGLHDFIFREQRETLEKWALTVEAHHQQVTGKKILGGLHGRRNPLTNDEYANYVLDMTKLYPGLNSRNELERLSAVYGFSDARITSKIGGEGKGGLHDYLFRQPRETLVRWALSAEEFYKQKTGKMVLGGLHGRMVPLTNQEYAEYISDMAKQFPELDNGQELDKLSKVYGFADNPSLGKSLGGLHDYIFRTDRNTLIRWALTAEAHEHKIKNAKMIIGGLNDYIEKLSNEEIGEYVLRVADSYQELNSAEALNSYSLTYGILHEGGNDKKKLAFLA